MTELFRAVAWFLLTLGVVVLAISLALLGFVLFGAYLVQ